MRIEYHPSVRQDVVEATRRYHAVSKTLAKEFKAELRRVIAMEAASEIRESGTFGYLDKIMTSADLNKFLPE